mmetsp:Transcript_39671/g.114790  ORF Transcript_39671/g.114790 Transcript_39671/m.114790 type:complete len:526 (+) Transcript_39671:817-2394(+)
MCVDEGGIGDGVHPQTLGAKVPAHVHGAQGVACGREAFDEGRIHHRVHWHPRLPLLEQAHGFLDPPAAAKCIEHATGGDAGGGQAARLHHLGPQGLATLGLLQHAECLNEEPVCVHRGADLARPDEIRCDLLQPFHVLPRDAGIQGRVQQHLVLRRGHGAGSVEQLEGSGSIAGIARTLGDLHNDGQCVMVHGHTVALHLAQHVKGCLATVVGDGAQNAIVRSAVGRHPGAGHLLQQAPGCGQITRGTIALQQGVVRDAVGQALLRNFSHELAGFIQTARNDASIENTIVHGGVDARRVRGLGLPQGAERLGDIAVAAGGARQGNVLLHIAAIGLGEQGLGEPGAAATVSEFEEATAHDAVRLDARGHDLVVQVAGLLVQAVASIGLHQCLESRQGHHVFAAEVAGDFLSEVKVPRLAAAGHQSAAETLAGEKTAVQHLRENLRSSGLVGLGVDFQQGLVHGEWHLRLLREGYGIQRPGARDILTPQALGERSRDCVRRHLRKAGEAGEHRARLVRCARSHRRLQ